MKYTQSQGADDLRARLEEAERDGAKLQGLNQRLAARVAELEKQQEAGKAPACECRDAWEDRAWLYGYEQAFREWSACLQDSTLTPGFARIAEVDIAARQTALVTVRTNRSVPRAALSAPCPCAELRVKYTEAGGLIMDLERRLESQQRGCADEIAALVQQRDSLRAELAKEKAEAERWRKAHDGILAEAGRIADGSDLRARVETLEAALKHIARMVCFSDTIGKPREVGCKCFSCTARTALKEGK